VVNLIVPGLFKVLAMRTNKMSLDPSDIAYAIKSIRTTGGCIHDAEIIHAALEEEGQEYLSFIEMGLATTEMADDLEKMIWQKNLH
jgi:hypothetical protein